MQLTRLCAVWLSGFKILNLQHNVHTVIDEKCHADMDWKRKSSAWSDHDFSKFRYRRGETTVVTKQGVNEVKFNHLSYSTTLTDRRMQ
jgi:hypothetical protein